MRIPVRCPMANRFARAPYSKNLQTRFAPRVQLNRNLMRSLIAGFQHPVQSTFWDPASRWEGPQITILPGRSLFDRPVW